MSKPGPKPALTAINYVFREVELKSPAWKHFLRDQKNGVAKCKICDSIMKADSSTSGLVRHLEKVHKIDLKSSETLEEPPAKKDKIQAFFSPKEKAPELQELVAKMSAVDGFSFNAIAKSESLQYVFKKAGYTLPKADGAIRDLAMNQYETLKKQIKLEISEAKKSGFR